MSSSRVYAETLAESEFDAWSALVAESPDGSPYSTPEYLDALCTAAGGRFRILGVRHGEELVGGVGVYERDSAYGRYVSPRLLLYYNGPVLRRFDTRYPSQRTARRIKALEALERALAATGYASVILKCRATIDDVRPFLVRGWSSYPSYTYAVDISDLDAAWSRVEQNLRRLVKRCTRAEVSFGEDTDFAGFFELHERTLARRGLDTYLPRGPFARYFETLSRQGLCRLYQARLPDGRPIAAQLVLAGRHPASHTVCAAADPEFMNLGASAFLRWKAFEALADAGYTANDLTDAALNPVTHFKSQLGGALELCLVLRSRPRTLYRWGTGTTRLYRRVRGGAASRVRRAIGRLRRGADRDDRR